MAFSEIMRSDSLIGKVWALSSTKVSSSATLSSEVVVDAGDWIGGSSNGSLNLLVPLPSPGCRHFHMLFHCFWLSASRRLYFLGHK